MATWGAGQSASQPDSQADSQASSLSASSSGQPVKLASQLNPKLLLPNPERIRNESGTIMSTSGGATVQRPAVALGATSQPGHQPVSQDSAQRRKNQALQAWGNHFIAHPLSDGARWEQLLGRSHRQGQKRKVVTVTVPNYDEFSVALASGRQRARYIEDSTGLKQR